MKKYLLLIVAATLLIAMPAMAARVTNGPITHEPCLVLQAYEGNSDGANVSCAGYAGTTSDATTSVSGILEIAPGDSKWANFVKAAQAGQDYNIKNVVLIKQTPQVNQCADIFPSITRSQQGTPNIRLWWPLMFEVPGTTWTLTITYGTPIAWADGGLTPLGTPNPPGYVHVEIWSWQVDATLDSMEDLLQLFHELPFGLDEVPLISDEVLYPLLQAKLDAIEDALAQSDTVSASLILTDFELEVMDACIEDSPIYPNPTGLGTGIAQDEDNPACCKLLVDAEFVGYKYNIFQPAK